MVKETISREPIAKKKRKTSNASESETVDPYKSAVNFEHEEALSRSNEQDAELYFTTCQQIRTLLAEIAELKQCTSSNQQQKIDQNTTKICLRLVVLKKLNRMEKVRQVVARDLLQLEKQKVDSVHLQYQNLLYEANHLKLEHRKCLQFKSKDEAIDLVPVEQFLLEAPRKLTENFQNKSELDDNAKHELRLARLEWELEQRMQLADHCRRLEDEKKQLYGAIEERKMRLAKLGPLLNTVLQATRPVQDHLGMPIEMQRNEHKFAALLPVPLYILYANFDAYRRVTNDSTISISINGDQQEAHSFQREPMLKIDDEPDEDDEEDEIDEEDDMEISRELIIAEKKKQKKKRHHRTKGVDEQEDVEEPVTTIVKTVEDPLVGKRQQLLKIHPLSILIAFTTATPKSCVTLKLHFNYCVQLELVTVKSDLICEKSTISGQSGRALLTADNILTGLLSAEDMGVVSPNPCTNFQLAAIGIATFRSCIADLGHAYNWAQKMCGLNFLEPPPPTTVPRTTVLLADEKISQYNVENVTTTIKTRLNNLCSLAIQLELLEKNILPSVPDDGNNNHSSKTTILSSFHLSSYQQLCESKVAAKLLETDAIHCGDTIFLAKFVRNSNASVQAYIAVKNDYPNTPPIFIVFIPEKRTKSWKSSDNDDDLRDLERAINVEMPQTTGLDLLVMQIRKLCTCFDIYIHTGHVQRSTPTVNYIKPVYYRNRRKPFRFRNIGVGVYTQ